MLSERMDENPPPYTEKNGYHNEGFKHSVENINIEEKGFGKEVNEKEDEYDPWALPDLENTETPWDELNAGGKILRVIWIGIRVVLFVAFLYFFICSLTFLSDGFKLVGGKTAGDVFRKNEILSNPVAGLMIGVLATVLLQSSSTTTSIVVSMVGGGILGVKPAIPIVMGANIGTSVTNTIVSMGQIAHRDDFRRAFAGATVHDMFNWLTVIILLPIEVITGYLYELSSAIVGLLPESQEFEKQEYLKKVTKPLTNLIIILDSKKIREYAKGTHVETLLKDCCVKGTRLVNVSLIVNETAYINTTMTAPTTMTYEEENICVSKCEFVFKDSGLSDGEIGAIILVSALILLCICLLGIVKTLNSLLRGNIRKAIRKFINYDFPGRCGYFTGYIAIIIGTGLTFLVQSSSIFTSTLTPLVGVGVISLERMYPLTLGANIGTTTTSILAALASDNIKYPFQVSMCHLFFNLSGILLFYPIPYFRFPIPMAKFLGMETSKYRWFALVYLFLMFFVFPAAVFGLSLAGWYVLLAVLAPVGLIIIIIVIIKAIQHKNPKILPRKLQNFKFLPVYFRSLEPIDTGVCGVFSRCTCCPNYGDAATEKDMKNGRAYQVDNTRL